MATAYAALGSTVTVIEMSERLLSPFEPKAGEAVAAGLLARGVHCAFRQIGLPDAYLDAGALPTLHDRYGISIAAITARVKSWL